MVTHDREVAAAADRIVHMRDGRIDDGTTAQPPAIPDLTFKTAAGD
jgi:ABC-type lipoprotein export system ATPase subunit